MEPVTSKGYKFSYRLYRDGELRREEDLAANSVTIGRAESNVIILDDPLVADLHAVIKLTDKNKLILTDLGSDEGTYVDDERVDMRAELPSACEVRIGPFELHFVLEETVLEEAERAALGEIEDHSEKREQASRGMVGFIFESWDKKDQGGVDNTRAKKVLEVFEIWGDTILSAQQYPRSIVSIDIGAESRRRKVDYVIAIDDLPSRPLYPFIKGRSGVPHLRFAESTDGELHFDGRSLTLADAVRSGLATRVPGGALYEVPLTEDARFVVNLGPITFVGGSAFPAKKPLAAGKMDIDTSFMALLLLVGLLFGSASLYMMTLPPPPEMDISQIPDRFAKLIVPKKVEKTELIEKKEIRTNAKVIEEEKPKEEKKSTKRDDTKKIDRKKIDQAALDKKIAERSGLLGELNKGDGGKGLFGQGLGSGVMSGVAGLLGTTGSSHISGAPAGSRGLGFGGGGAAGGIGGVGTKGEGGGGGDDYGEDIKRPKKKAYADIDVSGGNSIVLGALDKALVDKVIRDHLSSIRYCYQQQLVRNPQLAGKVTVKFTIIGDGSVSQSNVKNSTMDNAEVEKCVSQRIQQLRFPEPKGGGIVTVSYPFFFKAAG